MSQVIAIDESDVLHVRAASSEPFEYFWWLNDTFLSEKSDSIKISYMELDQDTSEIYCIAANAQGNDTSNIAFVYRINNHRPVALIHTPDVIF